MKKQKIHDTARYRASKGPDHYQTIAQRTYSLEFNKGDIYLLDHTYYSQNNMCNLR